MNRCKILKINVPASYEPSEFFNGCTPKDYCLLINYGEALLKSHRNIVSNTIESSKIKDLTQSIRDKESKLDQLRKIIIKSQQDSELQVQCTNNTIIELKALHEAEMLNREKANTNAMSEEQNRHNKELENMKKTYIAKYNSLSMANQQEVQQLNDKINNLLSKETDNHNRNLVIMDEERERIKKDLSAQYNRTITILEEQIKRLADEKTFIMSREEDKVKELNSKLDAEREGKVIAIKEAQQIILDKMNPVLQYLNCDNMIDKGNKGENMVLQILNKYYYKAIIKNVSGEAHRGDIHFTLDNVKCLIEVKREKTISAKDIDKFLSDIRTHRDNINCALFVSLETETIPKRGSFYIEVISNIPILYIYLYNADYIKYAINVLQSLTDVFSLKTKKEIISNEFQRTIKNLVSNQYSALLLEKKRLDSIIKQLNIMLQSLKKSQYNIDKSLKNIILFYDENTDMQENNNKRVEKEDRMYSSEQMEKLKIWTVENNKPPTRDDVMKILGLSYYDTSKVSMRKLKSELSQYIKK